MNAKAKGEKGERIVIGELAKFDIDVAIPLTDNFPLDFIAIHKNKLYKIQVKSSSISSSTSSGSIMFDLSSNNWYNKTNKKYTKKECDIFILCDYENIYLLGPKDFSERRTFSIRKEISKNNQSKNINHHDDYIISNKRIKEIFK